MEGGLSYIIFEAIEIIRRMVEIVSEWVETFVECVLNYFRELRFLWMVAEAISGGVSFS